MPTVKETPYSTVLKAHKKRESTVKTPGKTRDKILAALEKAVESALKTLSQPEGISAKEHKEILGLLMKAAEQMVKYAPARTKPFNPTQTDKALLDIYVKQRNAGTL